MEINFQPFPALENTDSDGLLAMGGDLSVDTLVSAYAQGIFPWFNEGQPILWWSPDPRLVLFPSQLRIGKSLRKSVRNRYHVTCNVAFEEVILNCALRGDTEKKDTGTWITEDMNNAYIDLHRCGYAHSVEVWKDQELVGGLYGIALGSVFFGESMFSHKSDASKVGLVYLCQHLINLDFKIIDCQVSSSHLLSLGAINIDRNKFMSYLFGMQIDQPHIDFSKKFPAEPNSLHQLLNEMI
ncbi:MAG: leucyl/phenylalanyl-tRNA--protein transferase [Gammaproteobacteria bacterium]|nr:leucyl/phenylalanyl-tRNA--protein transferase [Gammaproteobacteria bacterium]